MALFALLAIRFSFYLCGSKQWNAHKTELDEEIKHFFCRIVNQNCLCEIQNCRLLFDLTPSCLSFNKNKNRFLVRSGSFALVNDVLFTFSTPCAAMWPTHDFIHSVYSAGSFNHFDHFFCLRFWTIFGELMKNTYIREINERSFGLVEITRRRRRRRQRRVCHTKQKQKQNQTLKSKFSNWQWVKLSLFCVQVSKLHLNIAKNECRRLPFSSLFVFHLPIAHLFQYFFVFSDFMASLSVTLVTIGCFGPSKSQTSRKIVKNW